MSFSARAERAGGVVLASRAELDAAAVALDRAGWSWKRRGRVTTRAWTWLAERGLVAFPLMRDRTKSWDVWRAVSHCLETVPLDGAVLDVGAWQSEVLWALGRVGFSALRGCDTDARVTRMPGRSAIRYEVADFFALEDRPASLGALTCLSVIEHGMDAEGFFSRAAKLLAPGGRLLLTTDYWPTPIDTRGIVAFGRPWTVLSRSGAEGWLELAQSLGLEPDGLVSLEATDAPVTWSGRSYTFLWLAFRKRD